MRKLSAVYAYMGFMMYRRVQLKFHSWTFSKWKEEFYLNLLQHRIEDGGGGINKEQLINKCQERRSSDSKEKWNLQGRSGAVTIVVTCYS